MGLSDAIAGPTTVKVDAEDVAPPGLCTVRLSLLALAIRLAGIVAVMDVAVPAVTANAVVPAYTSEPAVKFPLISVVTAMKLAPVTVIVVRETPAAIEAGLSDVIVGPLTVNVLAEEDAAFEFRTVTFCGPAEASCVLVTAAVSEVAPPS